MKFIESFKNILSSIGGHCLLWKMEHFPNEEDIRLTIRTSFEESVRQTIERMGDKVNDPMWRDMHIQGAISDSYQSMIKLSHFSLLALKAGIDYDKLVEEECQRALNKYLEL